MTYSYLTNFRSLPILANSFWNIAKTSDNFRYIPEFYNKRLSLVTKDFSFYCIVSKKYYLPLDKPILYTDELIEKNNNINSNLMIISKNYRIKEFCNYCYCDRNNYLDLDYSLKTVIPELKLKDNVNLNYEFRFQDNLEISNNFYSSLLPKTQEILFDIKQILEKNKDKIEMIGTKY